MKNNPAPYDKIEQYLLGRLPRDEHLEMERAIREQPDLAEEVELRRLEFDTAEELIAGDIRALFQQLREQEKDEEQRPEPGKMSPRWGGRWYYYAAAASVALLAFLLYRSNERKEIPDPITPKPDTSIYSPTPPQPPPPSPPPVAQDKVPSKPQPDARRIASAKDFYNSNRKWNETSSVRGTVVAGSQNVVDRADSLWQRGEYGGMLQFLDTIRTGHPRYYAAQLLRAHANFSLGKYKEAAAAARIVVGWKGKRDETYVEEAEWLLVLSLLAEGKSGTDEFRTASENILSDKGRRSYADMVALRDELLGGPNFVPDLSMEALVMGGSRSEGLTVKISSPLNSALFVPDKNGEVLIRFAGTVEDATAVALTLNIFDNKNSNKPRLSVPLELKKDDVDNMLTFNFQQRLKVVQGLYYFTIEQRGGAPMYAGKFIIKN